MECYPNGRGGPQAGACLTRNIRSYPTWFFGDSQYTEIISIKRLAQLSRYVGKGDQ